MEQRFTTEYLDEKFALSPDHDTDDHDHGNPQRDHAPKGDPDTRGNHAPKGDRGYEGNRGPKDDTAQDDGSRENDHDLNDADDLDDETIGS